MDNFLGGFHAVVLGMIDLVSQVMDYPVFTGFVLGFITSTFAHAILFADHARDLPKMLLESGAKSFEQLNAPQQDGTYGVSYTRYLRTVNRTKILVVLAVGAVLVLVLLAIVTN